MLYDYECAVCGSVQEVDHPINETPTITCQCQPTHPVCKRIISGCTFVLKGSGWAVDGYSKTER